MLAGSEIVLWIGSPSYVFGLLRNAVPKPKNPKIVQPKWLSE